ncbi:MAG: PDZ domain-containing protein [Phycisphaerales bacterium]|nr:MAG: PDZ domain-containing protein [Phycisphaerales bacterium]
MRPHGPIVSAPASEAGAGVHWKDRTVDGARAEVPDNSVIIEQNIFGGRYSKLDANETQPGDSSSTSMPSAEKELGLNLVGVVCGPPAFSRAIIMDVKGNTLDRYMIGQTIAGARVESIREDAVILLHNGREKMLSLKVRGRGKENGPRAPLPQTSDVGGGVGASEHSTTQVRSAAATRLGRVETVLRQAVIEPHTVDGRVDGLRLTGLDDIPAAREFGLKNGDIINAVNGHAVTSKQKAFQVLMKARSQPQISIEMSRGDKTRRLSFDLR